MKILVVGAGIGGLALAALLKQRGISVSLIERAASFDHAGYMLSLYPIGSRVLHGLGAYRNFVEQSSEFRYYEIHNSEGELLHRFDFEQLIAQFGYIGQILRKDLLNILRSASPDVPLQMNTTLTALEQRSDKVVTTFSDGTHEEWDGVVGADGIHSLTRQLLFGQEPDHETGWGLWVWWLRNTELPRDTVTEYWGKGRFVGVYPTPDQIGAIAAAPKSLISEHAIDGDGTKIFDLFDEMSGGAKDVLQEFPKCTEDLFFWNLSDFRSKKWVKGRVALLGDSACAFLPTVGVGASMALESAAVMADELSRTDARFLPHAFELYERRRKHRAESAQNDSRKLAAWMAAESSAMVWTRDHYLKFATLDSLAGNMSRSFNEPI